MASPEDLVAHAVKLLASATGDLDYRVVIDRAYYGAYHAALQFEEKLPVRSRAAPKDVGVHEALMQRLERPDTQLDYGLKVISKDLGTQMRMLKPLREIASYELGEAVQIHQAEAAVRAAREVLSECARGASKLRPERPAAAQ